MNTALNWLLDILAMSIGALIGIGLILCGVCLWIAARFRRYRR